MKNTISRKTTKMAVFCSCVGSTSVDSCCTSPMVMPPQNGPMMLPSPPSTTPAYMMMTYSSPTIGVERIVGGEQPAGDGGDADTERKGDAVGMIDVDAHVGGGLRIVGGRPQRLAEPRAADQQGERDDGRDRDQRGDAPRLVDEDRDKIAPQRAELPGAAGQRRAHRHEDRAEGDQARALDDERDAEREDELREVALALDLRARAAHAPDQGLVDDVADTEQHGARQHGGNIGAEHRSEQRLHAEGSEEIVGAHTCRAS